MHEITRGGKHYLRKSSDCKAQIIPVGGVSVLLISAMRSADFSGGVYHLQPQQSHAQSLILFPIFFALIRSFFFFLMRRMTVQPYIQLFVFGSTLIRSLFAQLEKARRDNECDFLGNRKCELITNFSTKATI